MAYLSGLRPKFNWSWNKLVYWVLVHLKVSLINKDVLSNLQVQSYKSVVMFFPKKNVGLHICTVEQQSPQSTWFFFFYKIVDFLFFCWDICHKNFSWSITRDKQNLAIKALKPQFHQLLAWIQRMFIQSHYCTDYSSRQTFAWLDEILICFHRFLYYFFLVPCFHLLCLIWLKYWLDKA